MYGFGAGTLIGVQTQDATGAAVANATPVQFGTLQDVSGDISFEEKLLYGAYQFPVAAGRGKGKITFKAKTASLYGSIFGDLFVGTGSTAGIKGEVINQPATIPATPYQVNPTIPASGTFASDLGVLDATTLMPYKKVASGPTTGQYALTPAAVGTASFATNIMTVTAVTSGAFAVGQAVTSAGVAAGTYISSLGTGTGGTGTYNLSTSPGTIVAQAVTAGVAFLFAAADTGKSVLCSLEYSAVSTTGKIVTITNQLMGYAPTFRAALNFSYGGKSFTFNLNSCISSKLSLPLKNDDFVIPEFDFSAVADAAGNIGYVALSE